MPRILKLRRGTSTELNSITGSAGEIFVDLTANTLRVHNGVIQGGVTLATVGDVALKQNTLQSGTNIKTINGQSIVGSGNINTAAEIDLSAIMEDVTPAIGGVYDIGTPEYQWYNGYFVNKIDIDGIAIANSGDGDLQITTGGDLQITAETIVTDGDLIANSLLLDDIFISSNIITPLSTPLYGQREVVIDGGLQIASEDPAYIRLNQEIPIVENTISQRFSTIDDGFAFNWQGTSGYSYGSNNSLTALLDVSMLAPGFPQQMWIYNDIDGTYTQNLSSQLIPGVKYKIEIEVIAASGYPMYVGSRTVLQSYVFEDVEYVGSAVFAGDLYLQFKTPSPGSTQIIGGIYYYQYYGQYVVGTDFIISANYSTTEYDYSVLNTYGSEGMIRFNPETKEFQGHNGTEWGAIGGSTSGGSATVCVNQNTFSITSCLTYDNPNNTGNFNNFLGYIAGNCNTSGCSNNFFGPGAGCGNTTGYGNNFFGEFAGCGNTSGFHNNFFGKFAGLSNTSGYYNNFFGRNAGRYNTSGNNNNFFGYDAGRNNTTGFHNNFFGCYAGLCNTTGSNNNFFGFLAGRCNTTGSSNNFFGANAGRNNQAGYYNNFFGLSAGCSNYCGFHNNFFGRCAGSSNYSGSYNNFFGVNTGRYNTIGSNNNFFGYYAGLGNYSGSNNNFFGSSAGRINTTGSINNFFGYYAGRNNTTGCNNNFFGCYAGRNNTAGSDNNFTGRDAGRCNTTGGYNNFIGRSAGRNNTTGIANNFIGAFAGAYGTAGCFNNFIGVYAGRGNTSGNHNNFFGCNAGRYNTTGCFNNFIGRDAGHNNSTGSYNNFFGQYAGRGNTSGSNNILIGCRTGQNAACGLAAITTESNRIILGNCAHTCAQIQVAWTVVSDVRDKCVFGNVPHGRGFLQNLNPIEYAFKDRDTGCLADPPGKKRYGFTAQNILEQEGDNPVIVSTENEDKLQVTHDYLIPILVNAIKELSQEVDNIVNENKALKDRILNLERK